ncbi:unnamed protein product (macronuclear) [Paramecium tetraurelia]|uniref:cyclin-dependent kinase n=1 Tax=Paramecium tetraurelia TaxID=5888 RepID=A0D2G0_PARTE|nr:uncharacterized protein GSPATT00012735001 [Paramecium tetraurelia]CAK77227.1 unnamed protein product [Paramecium tetraurelia]|eukprot:XP_001444624.1 hypothetical protein (macronuclear) [Paramecium tetraurelia strain d4-2]
MNKYEVKGVVGEGAYGIVLKCENKENNQIVAIKKFKETEDNEIVKKSIQREVKMLRLLKHPNIIDLFEAFKRKGRIYLVFEYVEKNLLEVLQASPNGLDQGFLKKIAFQLLKAIEFIHYHDIVHRDIKPENILIDNENNLKLIDFGFARSLNLPDTLTDYVATRWYRSPELLLNYQTYGKGVDLWAIGCLLCELTDGEPMFPGENETDQLYLIQKTLGPLTHEQLEVFQKNPRFLGMKFPEIGKPETIERRYLGKLPQKAIGLVKGLLRMDPKERFTCLDALKHPYFADYPEAQEYIKQIESRQNHIQNDVNQKRDSLMSQQKQQNQIGHTNQIRTKNVKPVPNFLSSHVLMQSTAYNYKITDQHTAERELPNMKKTTSVDKLPQTQYNGFSIGNGFSFAPSKNQQLKATQPIKQSQPQIKIQNLNIIYNANTYNYQLQQQQQQQQPQQQQRKIIKKKS